MSINGILWAKKSNTYYECDRDRNFKIALYCNYEDLTEKEVSRYQLLHNDPNMKSNTREPYTLDDIYFTVICNIKSAIAGLLKEPNKIEYHYYTIAILHNSKILCMIEDLVNNMPTEEFYFYNDCGNDEYYEVKDKAIPHHAGIW